LFYNFRELAEIALKLERTGHTAQGRLVEDIIAAPAGSAAGGRVADITRSRAIFGSGISTARSNIALFKQVVGV